MTKIVRAGEDITEPTDSPTASTAVSHAQHTPVPWEAHRQADGYAIRPRGQGYLLAHLSAGSFTYGADLPEGPPHDLDANAAFIVRACNHHEALLEAVRAGGRYSDALRRYQDKGLNGQVIPGTDELDRLFMEWHDKGHAAIDKLEGK